MKKSFILLVVAALAVVSSCKKDSVTPSAPYKVKALGDLKEHTGWDHTDTTETGDNGTGNP